MAVFGTGLAFSGLDRRSRTPTTAIIAPSPHSIKRRGEVESPGHPGLFRPRRKITALHLRAPVLRARRGAADGRDRREVAWNRAADGPVHRNGFGAPIFGAAQDVWRDDVHRQ